MSTIEIRKNGITDLDTDAIVNAANDALWAGGGVCGAIFKAAGHDQLQAACNMMPTWWNAHTVIRSGHVVSGSMRMSVLTPTNGSGRISSVLR